jgi:TRAP-type C4-dicarboxylate transport system permease small subunit
MANVGRWLLRLFAVLALALFAALAVIFAVVTVDQFGVKEYVSANVGGLPPVWVISALLVLPCLAFVAGFWILFLDTFRAPAAPMPPEAEVRLPRSLLDRLRLWRRAH